jgi:anti-sigma-K factor RskA
MRYTDPTLLEHLASSYVLGTLAGGARRRFERLLRERGDVQLRVAQWEARLGLLATSVPAQRPSHRVWEAIAARTRPAAPPVALAHGRGGWRSVLWGGRRGVLSGAAAGLVAGVVATTALVLAVPTLFTPGGRASQAAGSHLPASYVGLLTDAAGNGKVLVSSLRHGRTMAVKVLSPIVLEPAPGDPPRTMVLWALPADGAPFVLGTVPATGSAVSTLPDTSEKLLSGVGRLMVTLEATAAPAAPSAKVLFTGACAKLW